MTGPKQDVAADYGEGGIEAKAMTDAAQGRPKQPGAKAEAPPADALIPAAGTTETDIADNLREKASRESKS